MAQDGKSLSDRLWQALNETAGPTYEEQKNAPCERKDASTEGEEDVTSEEEDEQTSGQLGNRAGVENDPPKRELELNNILKNYSRVRNDEDSERTKESSVRSRSQADTDSNWRCKKADEEQIATNRYFNTSKAQSDQHNNWRKKNSEEDTKPTFTDGRYFNRSRDESKYARERKPSFSGHEESSGAYSCIPKHEHEGSNIGYRRNSNVNEHLNQKSNVVERKPITKRRLGYKRLEELSLQSASQIIFVLANEYSGFDDLLKSNISSDVMILILRVLAKACDTEFNENKVAILSCTLCDEFLGQLKKFVLDLPLKRVSSRDITFNNILKFCENVITHLPHTASDKLEDIIVSSVMSINGIQEFHSAVISDDVKTQFLELHSNVKKIKESRKKCEKKYQVDHCTPPNNFREIDIFPSREDVLSKEPAFVRPNIVKGAYADVEHYLDVQFRLLREDFVGPLRDGIREYTEQISSVRNSRYRPITSLRIYRHVIFLGPRAFQDKVGHTVLFDAQQRLKHVQWEYSKRLIYGSLLLFTNNDFQTIIFGTVLARDTEFLNRGEILIEFCRPTDTKSLYGEYVMFESDVYFEPYRHVLRALQRMTSTDFPMERYIISVNSEVEPPLYLKKWTHLEYRLDRLRVVEKRIPHPVYRVDGHSVPILNLDEWPSAAELQLDISQYSAFQSALTKEFAIIQGPPGTGKTYLGLKIAEVLLSNVIRNSPLLVVCYTNHALDQFLEGISNFTQSLVRVGGQSHNDALKKYNLKEVRRGTTNMSRDHYFVRKFIHGQLEIHVEEITSTQKSLKALADDVGIVSAETLHQFGIISDELYDHFLSAYDDADSETYTSSLVDWLGSADDFEYDSITEFESTYEESVPVRENDPVVVEKDEVEMDREVEDALFNLDDVAVEKSSAMLLGSTVTFDLTFEELTYKIEGLRSTIEKSFKQPVTHEMHLRSAQEELNMYFQWERYLRQKLAQRHHVSENAIRRLGFHNNPWKFPLDERWELYSYWIFRLKKVLEEKLIEVEQEYQNDWKQYIELQHMGDLEILQCSSVVGMTTTGAAKLQTLLQALKPKVVIVEEAAEVLESHILVSLTSNCQHLILIGDHQQLKPSTAVYNLAKNFNFDVSLFERMIKNGMAFAQLKVQHRMRPEVAQLIVPAIYPNLENHPSVLEFNNIVGVTKNLFFITHNYPEANVDDTSSHQNEHEAEFFIEFSRHLVLQGYEQSKITILAAYSGQMFLMKKMKRKYDLLDGVRVTVVDNFQGEENDIILLSLVRNNEEGKIGFLKTENRVCVALSRARKGFYIMGNMDMLVSQSKIWPKINATLKAQSAVGTHLTLRCQVHSSTVTKVATAADFGKNTPEGGCLQICDVPLTCGHNCMQICHIMDRDHENYQCRVKCEKEMCELEHKCEKFCYEKCGKCMVPLLKVLLCGHEMTLPCHLDPKLYKCNLEVEKMIPNCQHKVNMKCSDDPRYFRCSFPCEIRLPCGHSCEKTCHVLDDPDHVDYKCEKPCLQKNSECSKSHMCAKQCWEKCGRCSHQVQKERSCGHFFNVECSFDPEDIICVNTCNKILSCGHPCRLKCNEICGVCCVKVKKVIEACGHKIKINCSEEPSQDHCRRNCEKILPCGHPCKQLCKDVCTPDCQEIIESPILSACGHRVSIFCYQLENNDPKSEILLSRCKELCEVLLQCGHKCQGTCGKCLQGRIHQACKEKCERTLICGHSCKMLCSRPCRPCDTKCEYKCRHQNPKFKCTRKNCKQPAPCIHAYKDFQCANKCGQPCVGCRKSCEWECEHSKCTKKCYEICDRPPCDEPCKKQLKCGHPCVGYCGEMCPPLCRICDTHALTEEFFLYGMEGEEDSRFVYLEDCGHTIEAKGLEYWLTHSDEEHEEIRLKTCPRCKTTITRNFRYGNEIKMLYADLHEIKMKMFGEMSKISEKQEDIKSMIKNIPQSSGYETIDQAAQKIFRMVFGYDRSRGNFERDESEKRLDSITIQSLYVHCSIVTTIYELIKTGTLKLSYDVHDKFSEICCKLVQNMNERQLYISQQELDDFNVELSRLYKMAEFFQIQFQIQDTFDFSLDEEEVNFECETIKDMIFSIEKYSDEVDSAVSNLLQSIAEEIEIPSDAIEMERKMIVHAIGTTDRTGRWFKCRRFHCYFVSNNGDVKIGECIECEKGVADRIYDSVLDSDTRLVGDRSRDVGRHRKQGRGGYHPRKHRFLYY